MTRMSTPSPRKNRMIEIIAGMFIILFLFSGLNQLTDLAAFRNGIGSSLQLYPYRHLLTWSVPVLLIITVVLLSLHSTRKTGLYVTTVLMLIFTLYMGYMTHFVQYRPCSCTGIIPSFTWEQHFVLNFCFFLLSLVAILLIRKDKSSGTDRPQIQLTTV